MKYAFIQEQITFHSVVLLCVVLKVSRSAFYDWQKRPVSRRHQQDDKLVVEIKASHENSRGAYGTRRIKDDLQDGGDQVSRRRISRLMAQESLQSKHKKKFKVTTDSRHKLPISPNLLNRDFEPDQPDQAYVADITYVWTSEGWLYLAVTIDLFSRMVVGWSLSSRMRASLVVDALEMAVDSRQPEAGLTHHSDRGSQYASDAFQSALVKNGYLGSMSRRGNCWDNAVAESFFKTLKQELVYHERFTTREQARLAIFEYIEAFYNRQRKHSRNEYLSPADYETQWSEAA